MTRRVEPTQDLVKIPNINGDRLLKRSAECLDILREITYIFYVGIEVFSRFADTCQINQEGV